MHLRHALFGLTAATAIFVGVGCAGTETGNGQRPKVSQVQLKLTDAATEAPGAPFVGADADGVAVSVEAAWANVDRIDFRFAEGESCAELFDVNDFYDPTVNPFGAKCSGDDQHLRLDGPFTVDLATGEASPSLAAVPLPMGDYRHAEAKLAQPTAAPRATAESAEHTLLAYGMLGEGEDAQPFALSLDFTAFAEFDGDFAAGAEDDRALLLFDVRSWFAALPLAECAANGEFDVDAEGTLLLGDGPGGCQQLEQELRAAILASGRLLDGAP